MADYHEVLRAMLDTAIGEACNGILVESGEKNEGYRELAQQKADFEEKLVGFLEGSGEATMTAEQRDQLIAYLDVLDDVAFMGMQRAYLAGMRDRYVLPKLLELVAGE